MHGADADREASAAARRGRRLSVPRARLADLAAFRAFVALACVEGGAPPESSDALVLAADEVCSNIVLHGYDPDAPGPITVWVDCVDDGSRVTIADTGRPFDPVDAPPPDLQAAWNERRVGGLGWFLVRQMVDELRYERRSGENLVTLIMRSS